MKKIYISGPMWGIPSYNAHAFFDTEARLKAEGYDVYNPMRWAKLPGGKTARWIASKSLTALLECDAIYMLQGWENSKGARAERAVAEWAGLAIRLDLHDGTPRSACTPETRSGSDGNGERSTSTCTSTE